MGGRLCSASEASHDGHARGGAGEGARVARASARESTMAEKHMSAMRTVMSHQLSEYMTF
jgi:hypothetical protein